MTLRQRLRARLGRQPPDEPADEGRSPDDADDREDAAARKRAELEVLRRIRETGWWWPDGS